MKENNLEYIFFFLRILQTVHSKFLLFVVIDILLRLLLWTRCVLLSGHMVQDCFYTPGGKTYELLEEEETPIFAGRNQLVVEKEKATKKSKKKEKVGLFHKLLLQGQLCSGHKYYRRPCRNGICRIGVPQEKTKSSYNLEFPITWTEMYKVLRSVYFSSFLLQKKHKSKSRKHSKNDSDSDSEVSPELYLLGRS